jgi:hypothetical protein
MPSALEDSLLSLKKAGPRRTPCCSRGVPDPVIYDNSGCSWDFAWETGFPESGEYTTGRVTWSCSRQPPGL